MIKTLLIGFSFFVAFFAAHAQRPPEHGLKLLCDFYLNDISLREPAIQDKVRELLTVSKDRDVIDVKLAAIIKGLSVHTDSSDEFVLGIVISKAVLNSPWLSLFPSTKLSAISFFEQHPPSKDLLKENPRIHQILFDHSFPSLKQGENPEQRLTLFFNGIYKTSLLSAEQTTILLHLFSKPPFLSLYETQLGAISTHEISEKISFSFERLFSKPVHPALAEPENPLGAKDAVHILKGLLSLERKLQKPPVTIAFFKNVVIPSLKLRAFPLPEALQLDPLLTELVSPMLNHPELEGSDSINKLFWEFTRDITPEMFTRLESFFSIPNGFFKKALPTVYTSFFFKFCELGRTTDTKAYKALLQEIKDFFIKNPDINYFLGNWILQNIQDPKHPYFNGAQLTSKNRLITMALLSLDYFGFSQQSPQNYGLLMAQLKRARTASGPAELAPGSKNYVTIEQLIFEPLFELYPDIRPATWRTENSSNQ